MGRADAVGPTSIEGSFFLVMFDSHVVLHNNEMIATVAVAFTTAVRSTVTNLILCFPFVVPFVVTFNN